MEELQLALDKQHTLTMDIKVIVSRIDKLLRHQQYGITSSLRQSIGGIKDERGESAWLESVNAELTNLNATIPELEYFKYHTHFSRSLQTICFLLLLDNFLLNCYNESEKKDTSALDTLLLGYGKVCEKVGTRVTVEDYLHGVLMLGSELSHSAIQSVIREDFKSPLLISEFITSLHSSFQLLSLRNDSLRKHFDSLKYEVKRVEEVVYGIKLRQLSPKP